MITGIVMASGFGHRMGQNKLMLPLDGKAIFQHVIHAIKASNMGSFMVVTSHKEILSYCEQERIPCVWNDHPEEGQTRSIQLGVSHCVGDSAYMFFVADQPRLSPATINLILDEHAKNPEAIIVPTNKNNPSSPTIFPNWSRNNLLKLTGDVGGKQIIQEHAHKVIFLPIEDAASFIDIDTPEDYDAIRK